jgi:RNA 2',3'-cyclic 3'-phosphodiesterase
MFRLFVGIGLPEDVRLRLAHVCAGVPGAKWIDAQSMHLTLRFIGEVGGGDVEDIDAALQRVAVPAFDLAVSDIGCFESGGKVHTLWAGVEKQPSLLRLRDKVESAVVRAGCEPERRKFKAHITLARFRNAEPARVASFIQRYNPLMIGPFAVDQFILFRSHLGSEKAHYEALAEYPLGVRTLPQGSLQPS